MWFGSLVVSSIVIDEIPLRLELSVTTLRITSKGRVALQNYDGEKKDACLPYDEQDEVAASISRDMVVLQVQNSSRERFDLSASKESLL